MAFEYLLSHYFVILYTRCKGNHSVSVPFFLINFAQYHQHSLKLNDFIFSYIQIYLILYLYLGFHIQASVFGYLECSQIMVSVNTAKMNVEVQMNCLKRVWGL